MKTTSPTAKKWAPRTAVVPSAGTPTKSRRRRPAQLSAHDAAFIADKLELLGLALCKIGQQLKKWGPRPATDTKGGGA
jgi:hypothetical protein